MMNPLEVFIKSSLEVSPSLIEYEIGSEVEIILYHYLKSISNKYENIFIVSFFDAHQAFFDYLKRVLNLEKINNFILIPVYSKKEDEERIDGSSPVVLGALGKRISKEEGKSVAIMLGLDFYSIIFGENNFAQFYPRVTKLKAFKEDLDIVVVLNTKLFSEKILQVVDSLSFTIAKLGIEEDINEFVRYMLLLRTVFVDYNLKKWYYRIERGKLVFYKRKTD